MVWPKSRAKAARLVLSFLPAAALGITLYVLLTMASFDVVGFYVWFYAVMGFVWILIGVTLIARFLDISFIDDAVILNNKAALFPAVGGFLGTALIFAGANIGDGPGWWVVITAAGLGTGAWLILAFLLNVTTHISERITVDRDIGCGIRFGGYLLAGALILARASGGDWTSLAATLNEFLVGWPILPLTAVALLVEAFEKKLKSSENTSSSTSVSAVIACLYLVYAVAALYLLPPFNENPLFGTLGAIRL